MTERLYYQDPYVTSFEANAVKHLRINGQLAVILDRTHFYPTSGGQPCDLGTINGVRVVDVFVRDEDDAIVHLLDDEIWSDHIQAEIDWPRRFDHMQQHTGQHILSAAFELIAQAETVGFHLGAEAATIDLDVQALSAAQIQQVEDLANEIVYQNRRVRSTFVSQEQAAKLPFRRPLQVSGPVRVVDIEKFDLAACGGTHVRSTGELGMVKIVKLEHQRRRLRVTFLCGRRALADYHFKNQLVNSLANEFSVGEHDLKATVDRLRDEVKALRGEMRKANEQLLEYEARDLLAGADIHGSLRVVSAVYADRDRQDLNWLSRALISQSGVVALLGVAGEKPHILFARAQDVDRDMRLLLKTALRVLGSTTGGGRAELAQGGGPAADKKRVEQAVDRAKRLLLAQRT
jgi:alanyl-tRNA synthetase